MEPERKSFLRTADVAKELGVAEATVRRYTRRGLPYYQLVKDGPFLFVLDEVRQWVRDHREGPDEAA